jgi:4-oxalocrotonate tautomerase
MAYRTDGTSRPSKLGEEKTMPLIQVKLIGDVFTAEQKKEMIDRLTDAMVSIEGENMRQVTWVTIEEVRSGDWGIAGMALTTDDVFSMMAGHNRKHIECLDLDTIPLMG